MIPLYKHPVEIQDLVKELIRTKKGLHGKKPYYEYNPNAGVSEMLFWADTPQGSTFWFDVSEGKYEKAKSSGRWPAPMDAIVNDFQIF